MLPHVKLPTAKTVLSAAASAAATVVFIRSIARDLLPYEIHHYLRQKISFLISSMSPHITVTIDELEGLHENQLFEAAEVYLGAKIHPSTHRLKAAIPHKETKVLLSMDKNQEVVDVFNGVSVRWIKVNKQSKAGFRMYDDDRNTSTYKTEVSRFELSFHKKHCDMVFNTYFPYILCEARKRKQQKKTAKIHTLKTDSRYGASNQWVSVNLDHPSTFDTMAMDIDSKKTIMEDLELFLRRKDYYRKVGKAWKRGYLLFGPPGTGKSSLIAAMANYLKFDIYDLELTALSSNSELRRLIIGTANRSILVVEDIDCSIDLDRKKKAAQQLPPYARAEKEITLSGLLNFIDGLWSSCGDERIIIFTTNHKERLDPALLRPGRMDVHIHMSYCTPCGFKMLASNYLGLTDHSLFVDIEEIISDAKVTPADVGEQLLKTEDPEAALNRILEFLKAKKSDEGGKMVGELKEEGDMSNKILSNGGGVVPEL